MLRIEYDAVVGFHPYRTAQPWDLGGVRLLQVDGVNGVHADSCLAMIRQLEDELVREASAAGLDPRPDNHYGFTVRVDGRDDMPDTYYQYRFSNSSVYLWIMPQEPRRQARQMTGEG